jgi:aspartate-semialdehyde dehydrogenase
LALALAPLHARFEVVSVVVTTMQAPSGADYPGVVSLDVVDNVMPFISGEEEKIESETLKIVGRWQTQSIQKANILISAQCHRVNVSDGHLVAIRVKVAGQRGIDEIRDALRSFTSLPQELGLHSAPQRPIIVRDECDRPQPRLDRNAGNGMSITIGRIARDRVLDYHFVALGHNTIRGAAGAAILMLNYSLRRAICDSRTKLIKFCRKETDSL